MANPFEEQYLGMIVQAYEKEVMRKQTSKAYKLMLNKSINDLTSITSISRKSLKKFPGSSFDFDSNPNDANKRTAKKIDKKTLEKAGLEDIDEDSLTNYLEKCFGCDLRLQFDFQLVPPDGLLDGLNDLLSQIDAIIGKIEDLFNSKKKIEQICALASLFDPFPCPQDLLNLIMALKLLLGKYGDLGLSLKIDWFTLLGPIIQSLAQILSLLVNLLYDIISSPLDCTISLMSSNLALIRALDPASFATALEKSDESNKNFLTQKITSITAPKNDSTLLSINTENLTPTQTQAYIASEPKALILNTGLSFDFKLSDLISPKESNNGLLDLSLPEQMLASILEAKDFLAKFKEKIDALIASLNGLCKGNKLLEIQSITICIFITELISLIIQLMNTPNINQLCSDPTKTPELETFIKELTDSLDVSVTNRKNNDITVNITSKQGISEEVTINTCSLASNSVNISDIKAILEEIGRLTNG